MFGVIPRAQQPDFPGAVGTTAASVAGTVAGWSPFDPTTAMPYVCPSVSAAAAAATAAVAGVVSPESVRLGWFRPFVYTEGLTLFRFTVNADRARFVQRIRMNFGWAAIAAAVTAAAPPTSPSSSSASPPHPPQRLLPRRSRLLYTFGIYDAVHGYLLAAFHPRRTSTPTVGLVDIILARRVFLPGGQYMLAVLVRQPLPEAPWRTPPPGHPPQGAAPPTSSTAATAAASAALCGGGASWDSSEPPPPPPMLVNCPISFRTLEAEVARQLGRGPLKYTVSDNELAVLLHPQQQQQLASSPATTTTAAATPDYHERQQLQQQLLSLPSLLDVRAVGLSDECGGGDGSNTGAVPSSPQSSRAFGAADSGGECDETTDYWVPLIEFA